MNWQNMTVAVTIAVCLFFAARYLIRAFKALKNKNTGNVCGCGNGKNDCNSCCNSKKYGK